MSTPIQILLVEDNPADAIRVERMLEALAGDFTVDRADRCEGGLERLGIGRPDLVLLDLSLPDSFGVETLDRFTHHVSAPPVILLTGCGNEAVAVEAMKRGAYDYLSKDELDENRLQRAIQGALERAAYEEKVEELDRMKANFVATTSHELRTPLAIIREFVSLVRDGVAGPVSEQQVECLDSALRNCDRLALLISDTLDLKRLESGRDRGRRTKVDVAALVRTTTRDFRGQVDKKSQKLVLELPQDLPAVLGNPDQLTQVLVNLVGNAHKFTPEGGRLLLRGRAYDGSVVIDVEDDGPGIREEDRERVFEKFEQLDRQSAPGYLGTGLGLAIVKHIVDHHGGRVDLESTPGEGSVFSFSVPAYSPRRELEAFLRDGSLSDLDADNQTAVTLVRAEAKLASTANAPADPALLQRIESCVRQTLRRKDDGALIIEDEHTVVVRAQVREEGAAALRSRMEEALLEELGPTLPVRLAHGYLDAEDSVEELIERLVTELTAPTRTARKVLVVDDDVPVLNVVRRALEQSGFNLEVFVADDGYEGLLQFGRVEPDLVILDVNMPGFDGARVLERIKRGPRASERRVMIVSGSAERFDSLYALGADECLTKPLDLTELRDRAKALLWPEEPVGRKDDVSTHETDPTTVGR